MKNAFLIAVAALGFVSVVAFKGVKGKTFSVDPAASKVVWTGKKVTGEHTGNVSLTSGNLVVADKKLVEGTFVINLATITVTDITEADKNAKLVGHLKSEDFFSTEKFSTSQFVITKAVLKAGDQYELTGNLTIKGITQSVSFPATVKIGEKSVSAKATITVNRTKFDIKYKSANFFENLGDKAIYDDFTLDVDLVANAIVKS